MKNYFANSFCLMCAISSFVFLEFNYFAAYQLLPVMIFFIFQRGVFQMQMGRYLIWCYAFSILAFLVFPLVMQIGWYFDINEMASGSSTSGLLFVYLPIYATALGLIPSLIAKILKSKQL